MRWIRLPWIRRPWIRPPYRHSENSTCECGNNLSGQVECNMTTRHIYLYYCYCMTYDSASGNTFAGYCTYSTYTYVGQSQIYLPMDGRKIDIRMCARWKRTGILCSQCLDTYGVSLYTYDCQCIKCEGFSRSKVLKFLAVAFLPLTNVHHYHNVSYQHSASSLECFCFYSPDSISSTHNARCVLQCEVGILRYK